VFNGGSDECNVCRDEQRGTTPLVVPQPAGKSREKRANTLLNVVNARQAVLAVSSKCRHLPAEEAAIRYWSNEVTLSRAQAGSGVAVL